MKWGMTSEEDLLPGHFTSIRISTIQRPHAGYELDPVRVGSAPAKLDSAATSTIVPEPKSFLNTGMAMKKFGLSYDAPWWLVEKQSGEPAP